MTWLTLGKLAWKHAGSIALIILAIGAFFYIRHVESSAFKRGQEHARAEMTREIEAGNQQIRQRKRDARHETQALDRPAIVRELCRRQRVRNPASCH